MKTKVKKVLTKKKHRDIKVYSDGVAKNPLAFQHTGHPTYLFESKKVSELSTHELIQALRDREEVFAVQVWQIDDIRAALAESNEIEDPSEALLGDIATAAKGSMEDCSYGWESLYTTVDEVLREYYQDERNRAVRGAAYTEENSVTEEMQGEISTETARPERRYLVAAYHHFENGFDDKLDYYTLEEAETAAQGYVDGTMEDDGFKYDGAAVYDQQEHKCIRIYGDYPDEKAHAQVYGIAEPVQPEHFIDHFYVAEDIQKRGALDIKEYSSFEDALRAYHELPDTQQKALGAMNTRKPLPGSLDFVQCVDGKDTIIQDYS